MVVSRFKSGKSPVRCCQRDYRNTDTRVGKTEETCNAQVGQNLDPTTGGLVISFFDEEQPGLPQPKSKAWLEKATP